MQQTHALKEELIETDDDFRRLYEQHQEYKRQLVAFQHKTFPSQEDEIEMKRLKVEKLRLKDRMQTILHHHEPEAHAASV